MWSGNWIARCCNVKPDAETEAKKSEEMIMVDKGHRRKDEAAPLLIVGLLLAAGGTVVIGIFRFCGMF